ncbi:MAG: hypothetical protein M1142_04660 [Patescibacteria group bacterium]|nr:hypothetical protein [Patescibacteria group bacterium]
MESKPSENPYVNLINEPLGKRVEFALSEVEIISNSLVAEIEKKTPGHLYGESKATHMRHLASEASTIGKLADLTEDETQLLRVVLRIHDFGRHIEALTGEKPKLSAGRHGDKSIRLFNRPDVDNVIPAEDLTDFPPEARNLLAHPIVQVFSPEERYVINYATFWHAEREMPALKPDDPDYKRLANKICYLLRDLDKESIFLEGGSYFNDPVKAAGELRLHYLTLDERAVLDANPKAAAEVIHTLGQLLQSNQIPQVTETPPDLQAKITCIMNRGVADGAWTAFRNGQTVPLPEIQYSWTTYAFMHLAMLFDIKLPGMLKKIYQNQEKYLGSRLDFLKLKVSEKEYQEITKRLEDFF